MIKHKSKRKVVTSFLQYNQKILILKRSDEVKTYKNRWAAISGTIEIDETPKEAALREIKEETGLKDDEFTIINNNDVPLLIEDENQIWIIYTFLVKVKKDKIIFNWEHVEYSWINPEKIDEYDTVPKLKEALFKLL